MKSSRMKKILAVILCLTLGLSTNMMTMAESTNSPAVQSVQEEQQTDGAAVLAETGETVTPTPTATPEPETTPETTPKATATPTPEATPEATATPTPETTPEATATPTPETTPEATATPTPETTPDVTTTPEEAGNQNSEDIAKMEGDQETEKKPEDMEVAELFQYLLSMTDDNQYHKVWSSLSENKKEELQEYILDTANGETYYHDNTEGIVSNLNVAPLILNTAKAVVNKKTANSNLNEVQDLSSEAFNKVVEEPSDGLKMNKVLTEYDAETGKGKLKLEAYVTGEVTSTQITVPVDVVLVLDQSGSMDEGFGKNGYIVQNYTNDIALDYQNSLYVYYGGEYQKVKIELSDNSTENKISLGDDVNFFTLYNNWQNGKVYYYDVDGQRKTITVSRSGQVWDRFYTVQVNNVTIASGSSFDSVNTHMANSYPSGIYSTETQYEYIYKLQSGEEIGRSQGANGTPPITLFRRRSESITNLQALQTAASNFIDSVARNAAETGANHRIAVVGFASGSETDMKGFDGNAYDNTELFIGANQYNYGNNNIQGQYRNAFQDVTTSYGITNLHQSINSLSANGGTWPEYGFAMANNIFSNNPINTNSQDEVQRKRVIVFFSDGEPGNNDDNRPDHAYNDSLFNTYKSKNTYDATVYSVGIFRGANGTVGQSNNRPSPDSWSRANKFMHLTSQNYPSAQNMYVDKGDISSDLTPINPDNPREGYNSYYLSAANADELNNVFEIISGEIGGAKIQLDETTVLQDVMSEYFTVDTEATEEITAYTMTTNDNGITWALDEGSENGLTINTNEPGRIKVTGFNYSENYVAAGHPGKKLVVEIPISYNNEASFGGNNLPTNEDVSGIYNSTGEACYGNFEEPLVNVPIKYEFTAKSQTIHLTTAARLEQIVGYVNGYQADGTNNKFVDIVYTLHDANGEVIGTFTISAGDSVEEGSWDLAPGKTLYPSNLEECTNYSLGCTVSPSEPANPSTVGEAAVERDLGRKDAMVHVLVPQIECSDTAVFINDIVDLEEQYDSNTTKFTWVDKSGDDRSDAPLITEAPTVNVIAEYVSGTRPSTGEYRPQEDSNFKLNMTISGTDVTNKCKIESAEQDHTDDCIRNNNEAEKPHDFTIHVVAGSIKINKALTGDDMNKNLEGNPVFTFRIDYLGEDGSEKTFYRTIEFDEEDDNIESAEILSGLPRGTYTVTELSTQKFEYESLAVVEDGTTCMSNPDENKVVFYIGQPVDSSEASNDLLGKTGEVTFTNKKVGPSTNTDTDVVVNRFVYDETKNEWTIKQIWNPGEDQKEIDPVTEANQSEYGQ